MGSHYDITYNTSNFKTVFSNEKTHIFRYTLTDEERKKYGNAKTIILKLQLDDPAVLVNEEIAILDKTKTLRSMCPFFVDYYGYRVLNINNKDVVKWRNFFTMRVDIHRTFKSNLIKTLNEKGYTQLIFIEIEDMDGDLKDNYTEIDNKEEFKIAAFQMAYAMAIFNHFTENIHLDLKIENILVKLAHTLGKTQPPMYGINIRGERYEFASEFRLCVSDFGLSTQNPSPDFTFTTTKYAPSYYLMSIDLVYVGGKTIPVKKYQSRAYEDDVWQYGLLLFYLSMSIEMEGSPYDYFILNTLIPISSDLYNKVEEAIFKNYNEKKKFHDSLNPGEYYTSFLSAGELSDYIEEKCIKHSSYEEHLKRTIQLCIIQQKIGNGFLPNIRKTPSTLFKGFIHEAIEQSRFMIIGEVKTNYLDSLLAKIDPERIAFIKKALAWFPEERAFFGRTNPGHFANAIKDPYFDSLRKKKFSEALLRYGKEYVVGEDLDPPPKLDFMNPDVYPHLVVSKQIRFDTSQLLGSSIMCHHKKVNKNLLLVDWGTSGYSILVDADTKEPYCGHLVDKKVQMKHLKEENLENKELCIGCNFYLSQQ